ncbi:MAG: ATP-dependent DNA helicase [Nocardioidaceae bacterium]
MPARGRTTEHDAAAAGGTLPPTVEDVLHAAVGKLGGEDRPGQLQMARAVRSAMESGQHLLVQAGTGTGKSLGYLVPAVLHDNRVVVATATLALQHQLVERDIPALLDAAADVLGERPSYAVLKGRSNYACLHRVREGVPDEQGSLVEVPDGSLGAEVVRLRQWVTEELADGGSGDRDRAPAHTERVWQQLSVNHRECLGATRCPYAVECFAERAREQAMRSALVVTNHSLLAIDAIQGVPMLPEYDVVVVDEAHELVSRVTQAATDELSIPAVERAARRARSFVDGDQPDAMEEAADALRAAVGELSTGRIDVAPPDLSAALSALREAARQAFSAFPRESSEAEADAARRQARGMVDDVRKVAERMAAGDESDVLWLAERDRSRGGNLLCVAPLAVWGQLRTKLLSDKTVIFTSATLKLGGDFIATATSVGLKPDERVDHPSDIQVELSAESAVVMPAADDDVADGGDGDASDEAGEPRTLPWRGIDVGSPFDYAHQAILYVARHLPTPGRDGIGPASTEEIARLVEAAGGRTLGLFSSRRAAEAAAEAAREALPHLPILCQGDGQLAHLKAEFIANPAVSLFGTLSLWQGLDVPGATCQLVIIDRIPFPRPDDPLMSARARAAERLGGNGFMAVSATHAALLLAQGSGRLIRTSTDRGVVAVLDPRLATARYSSFLRASLPPMWTTYDRDVAHAALRRLDGDPQHV